MNIVNQLYNAHQIVRVNINQNTTYEYTISDENSPNEGLNVELNIVGDTLMCVNPQMGFDAWLLEHFKVKI